MNKITVVIPAFNEEKNLKNGVLTQVIEFFQKKNSNFDVLIVDDGSSDQTVKLVETQIKNLKNFRILKNPHQGKALTVMSGLLKATGEIVFFTDMDQATPISEIDKLLSKFDQGFDIVIGSRSGRVGAPIIRKITSRSFALLRTIFLNLPFKDTQCGFKGFTKKSVHEIFPEMHKRWMNNISTGAAVNAGFDIEMLFLAKKKGFKIAEVPVNWHHVDSERVQVFKDSIEAIKDMINIRINDLSGKYNNL